MGTSQKWCKQIQDVHISITNHLQDNLKMAVWCFTCFIALSICVSADNDTTTVVMNMDTFIRLVQDMESVFPESTALTVAKLLLRSTLSVFYRGFLTETQVNNAQILLTHKIVHSNETGWQEKGVVLAPDGSTVAAGALLYAMVWGWNEELDCEHVQSENTDMGSESKESGQTTDKDEPCTQRTAYNDQRFNSDSVSKDGQPISLATSLGLAFLAPGMTQNTSLSVIDGCWDSISAPKTFQLHDAPFHRELTLAFLNGAVDGTILGEKLRNESKDLSVILHDYYMEKPARSPARRQEFQNTIQGKTLEVAIHKGIQCYMKSKEGCALHNVTDDHLKAVAGTSAREFKERYLECPAIIPRCIWGAKPYKGTPTLLKTPLSQIYIHHTYTPSKPCTSFQDCAKDMRSMQAFHQQDRGWDDIGYSFVAGSDGYLYEGRGWRWVGAHTRGHNYLGYGVSFIGNFINLLPKEHILSVVKDRLIQCGVRSGYISPSYIVKGHRQLVNTSCPGDLLYEEIQKWENFKES
uniref:Peptidoglycan recognition protein 2 n=1 Tax=Leptobrachium leishanense TaxID=445787 RepID=A0A8C5R5A7_9ANUR